MTDLSISCPASAYMPTPADYRYFNQCHVANVVVFEVLQNTHSIVYDLASSESFIVQEVASRITALLLPIFYTCAAVGNLGVGVFTKVLNDEPFDELEHCEGGLYLKIGLFYLSQVAQSFAHVMTPQMKTVMIKEHLYESLPPKCVFFHTGYIERVGSNLVGYFGSRWVSFELQKRNLDVEQVYRQFNLSDQFQFSETLPSTLPEPYCIPSFPYSPDTFQFFGRGQEIESLESLEDYFRENDGIFEVLPRQDLSHLRIEWGNPEFKELIKSEIQPLEELGLFLPPEDCYSIAMHIRTGGDFDSLETKLEYPAKIPPFSYYEYALEQAVFRAVQKKENDIYIRIFTDDLSPSELKERIESFIHRSGFGNMIRGSIYVEICEDLETQKQSVLNDMFSLTEYDALIRPQSGFSVLCKRLTTYDLEIYPTKKEIQEDRSLITEVTVTTRKKTKRSRQKKFKCSRRPCEFSYSREDLYRRSLSLPQGPQIESQF